VALQVTTIMLGVKDLDRAKKFYAEGLGCTIDQDYRVFVSLSLGDGSSSLALYEREAAARDAGVPAEGSGFTGISFHYIGPSREAVDEVIASAVAAGGAAVRRSRKRPAPSGAGTSGTSVTRTAICGRWPPPPSGRLRRLRCLSGRAGG